MNASSYHLYATVTMFHSEKRNSKTRKEISLSNHKITRLANPDVSVLHL